MTLGSIKFSAMALLLALLAACEPKVPTFTLDSGKYGNLIEMYHRITDEDPYTEQDDRQLAEQDI